jgi:uncharacterized protein YydD (DUF2326 family)
MRLIALTSNRSSFKPVRFNRQGLTLIVGRHQSGQSRDLKKTYNGVGKSLIVALINYCLGANKNAQFDEHLPDWSFALEFEHAGLSHRVVRSTGESKLVFDEREMSAAKLREQLENLGVFELPDPGVSGLTFRSLLAFFLRPKNASYGRYDEPRPEWTPYMSVLCQAFLLGFDYTRAVRKHDQKLALDKFVDLATRYKKDQDLRQFYLGERNAEAELLELDSGIGRIERDLAEFRVSENYAERQQRADALHQEHATVANQIVVLENLKRDLLMSLNVRQDVPPQRVTDLYREASVALPELVKKRLDDVQDFQLRLQRNRRSRIERDIAEVDSNLASLRERSGTIKRRIDAELQYLNSHKALDEYAAASHKLAELRAAKQRINDYLQLLNQYTEEAQRVRLEMATETLDTTHYLRTMRAHLDMLMETFRQHAHDLYGSVPAGLTVRNNDGENQCRYSIEAHIQNDAADGINQGKIFCYDLLLLRLKQRHRVDFVFHDNRLYADMDKHQRYSLFRLADQVARDVDAQYIATVNEDVIDSVRDVAGDDFERLFVAPVVLELTDVAGGAGKLLGIQVDMNYEERFSAAAAR